MLTLGARMMGLVRKLAQSWAMSDGVVAGTYDTANTVPNVLFEVAAGGALAGAVIPLVSRFLARNLKHEASQTVSALITWLLTVSLPIVLLVVLFAENIIGFLLSSAIPQQLQLGASLLRIFAWQIPLYGLSVVFSGVLQAHKKFVLPALAPLLSSLVVVVVFIWYALSFGAQTQPDEMTSLAIALLGWGTTVGVVIFSLVQLPAVLRSVSIRLTWKFPNDVARETLKMGGAGLAALLAQQLAIIFIMYSTNALSDSGTFAAFNYAYAVFMVPYAVLAVPIATAVFPRISEAHELGQQGKLRQLVGRSTYLVLMMGATAAVLIAALSVPAKTVIELGNSITGLDIALQTMAFGAVGFSLLYHGARVLYALGRPRLVMISNSIAWFAVIVSLSLAYFVGVGGRYMTLEWVGLSMSIGMTVGAIVLIGILQRVTGASIVRDYQRQLVSGFIVLAIAGGVAWFVVPWLEDYLSGVLGQSIVGAFVAAGVGALIVLGPMAYMLGSDFRRKAFA